MNLKILQTVIAACFLLAALASSAAALASPISGISSGIAVAGPAIALM